jgi:hypothetical protein
MRKQQQLWRSLHVCLALFVLLAAGGLHRARARLHPPLAHR